MKKNILVTVGVILLLASNVRSHGVQVRHCISNAGKLRIFIEHWHGDLTKIGTLFVMTIKDLITGTSITRTPDGYLNNIDIASNSLVAGCASGPSIQVSTCNAYEFEYNDWVYFEYPVTCGTLTSVELQGINLIELTEACDDLYPAQIDAIAICEPPSLAPTNPPTDSPMSRPTNPPTNDPSVTTSAPTITIKSGKGSQSGGSKSGKGSQSGGTNSGSSKSGKNSKGISPPTVHGITTSPTMKSGKGDKGRMRI
jgi:hypothetical protein